MTTRYRVEYALKSHRRDQFIEWIKGLIAVPFVLHSEPTTIHEGYGSVDDMARTARERYADIFGDIEKLINDHIEHQKAGTIERSKLKMLVPTIGTFFTPILLREAFLYEDCRRHISSRRFVAPSFNNVRIILNTAQLLSFSRNEPLQLITFDGDVTLYDDGGELTPESPMVAKVLLLMTHDIRVGIVTAAGYTEASRYHERLHGLLDAIAESSMSPSQQRNLVVMGGESNFMFRFDPQSEHKLEPVPREDWALPEMLLWKDEDITELLDVAEGALQQCVTSMQLKAQLLRKERAVGIIPAPGCKFDREQLEETVLVTQKILEMSAVGRRLPFCAFNGGADIWIDIGDKSYGVLVCQRFFGGIKSGNTLHVGDQFLSAGANDFKARLACTTAWIASPAETMQLLDQIASYL